MWAKLRGILAQEKRTFKAAFKKHRCLVPISGWYEWKNVNDEKQPYFFYKQNELLKAAGLYWLRSSGDIEFSIITKEAEDNLLTVHNRTPLILNNDSQKLWTSHIDLNNLSSGLYTVRVSHEMESQEFKLVIIR